MTTRNAVEQRIGSKIPILTVAITADNGAPTDAAAASGTATFTGLPTEDETVTIDTTVYRWRDTLAQANDVLIGGTAAACVTNLAAAILATAADSGSKFHEDTVEHPTVTAEDGAGDTVDVTAKTRGTGGNSLATTETSSNFAWGAATLQNGVARTTVNVAEIPTSTEGQIRTYELTMVGSTDDTLSYNAFLWGDDSPDELEANKGHFSRLGDGAAPGDVNDNTAIANLVFRRILAHMGNQRFIYIEIDNLAGTNASIDEIYLREIVELNV